MSAGLILATIGFLIWDGVTAGRPPVFEIDAGAVRRGAHLYHLPLRVRNLGDVSVQAVQLRVELLRGDRIIAESEVTLDWLPGGSRRWVTATFPEDPRAYRVVASVRGYHEP